MSPETKYARCGNLYIAYQVTGEGPLGIQIRAGLHTGEVEMRGNDLAGIAVHTGARVAGLAGPDEVLVSGTVKDLVAGSGIGFRSFRSHTLKGLPGEWPLFTVEHQ